MATKVLGSEQAVVVQENAAIVETKRLFRRKPLLVEASVKPDGSWKVLEAGRTIDVPKEVFTLLYETVEMAGEAVDAGLPDMEPGTVIEKEGKRMVRVLVHAGRGGVAYWHACKPKGEDCGFKVVADVVDDIQASHRAGRFVDPFEGKPGSRTWVIMGAK